MKMQYVTISVKCLEESKKFYEGLLGFTPEAPYEKWQPYTIEGDGSFAIIEDPSMQRRTNPDIINFEVAEFDTLWEKIKDKVDIESPPGKMPWSTYKFVIKDPDGFRLGFIKMRKDV